MRSFSTIAAIAIFGCGATPAPTPKHEMTHPAAPPVVAAKPVAPPPGCETAAKLLVAERGVDKLTAAKQDRARRAGETEALAACLDDQWSDEAVACMSTRAAPSSCLGQLDEHQEHEYRLHVVMWERNWFKGDKGMGGDGYGGDPYGGGDPNGIAGMGHMHNNAPAREEWVPCELGEVSGFEPIIKPDAVDRDYALKLRKELLRENCSMRWSNTDKKCFNAATTAVAIAACRANLDDYARNAIANSLADSAGKLARLEALKKTPRAIECKAVSNVRYSDDAWVGKLVTLTAAERTRVIAESRTKMTTTCTADKWTPIERACLIAANQRELEVAECFPESRGRMMFRWGFPAAGVTYKSGIADCDKLGEVVKKLATCDKLEKDLRDNLTDMFGMQMSMWNDVPASSRAEVGKQCRDSIKMYADHAKEKGCTL